jgi:proteasome-associated ATPase
LFAYYGKKQIKGILLSGPPGCGKTMLGKAAANSLANIYGKENSRTGFLYVKGPEILNQYVGQTEQTIRDMFDDARRHKEENGYPAIIFLDEADAILAARGTRNVGIGNTIVPMFLTEMDGLEESGAIVIIATNRPDVLDPAVVRDGRIDRKVSVIRPNKENAAAILQMNLKKIPIEENSSAEKLAYDTAEIIYDADLYVNDKLRLRDVVNGAMLANCVSLAISAAVRRDMENKVKKKGSGIRFDDLKQAVERVRHQSAGVRHDLEVEG